MRSAEVQAFQTALFVDGLRPADKLAFASELRRASEGILDGDPAVVPIPDDITPEAPRIILKSSGEDYRCSVSITRLDVFLAPQSDEQKKTSPIDSRYRLLQQQVARFVSMSVDVRIFRVGLVGTFLLRLRRGGGESIRSAYLRHGAPITGANEIQVHALDRIGLLGELEANRWLRVLSLGPAEGGAEAPMARMVIDINTVADARYNFDEPAVTKLFDEVTLQMAQLVSEHAALLEEGAK